MLYMVAVIDFLEDRFGSGAIKMLAFSDFVFKLGDKVHCRSGVKVCEFMVPHRAGLKAVFGNTVVDSLVISLLAGVRDNDNVVDSLAISRQCSGAMWWIFSPSL
jgi:hypothetical protein